MRVGLVLFWCGVSYLALVSEIQANRFRQTSDDAASIEGTEWQGSDNDRDFTLRFIKGGILSYTTPTGTFRNASWAQRGHKVYFQTNQGYAEYEGTIEGNAIKGSAKNVNQVSWNWTAQKKGMLKGTGPTPQLNNTQWEGTDSDGDRFTFRFKMEPVNGELKNTVELIRPNAASKFGTWKQDDDAVYIEINNQFSEYNGKINGLTLEGDAKNKNNQNWTWKLTQKPDLDNLKIPTKENTKPTTKPNTPQNVTTKRTINLAGTTWTGTDSDGDEFSFKFIDKEKVEALRPNKDSKTGTYSIDNDTVSIDISNKFSTYTGKISGDNMEGSASNIRGLKWTWKLRKSAGPSIYQEEPSGPSSSGLAGSLWKGTDSDGDDFSFRFLPDGSVEVIRYDPKQDREVSNKNATWKLTGSQVYVEINSKFSEYTGTLSGDTLEGSAKNIKGRNWTWKLKRVDNKTTSIVGTKWKSRDSDGDEYIFHFREGGTLEFTSVNSGKTSTTATWRQTGNQIYMEMNNRFSEYRGTIQGNTIEGTASNIKNHKWTWKATKE